MRRMMLCAAGLLALTVPAAAQSPEKAHATFIDAKGQQIGRATLTETAGLVEPRAPDLLAVDEALKKLEELDPRKAAIVELRFFGGLDIEQTAESLGISPATVKRDWTFARAFLQREIDSRE